MIAQLAQTTSTYGTRGQSSVRRRHPRGHGQARHRRLNNKRNAHRTIDDAVLELSRAASPPLRWLRPSVGSRTN